MFKFDAEAARAMKEIVKGKLQLFGCMNKV